MKKSFWVAVVAAMIFAVNAEAQFSVGVGYANEKVISKTSSKDSDVGLGLKATAWDKSRKQLDGFYVEASYNWEFATLGSSAFALQPGVRYTLLTAYFCAVFSFTAAEPEFINETVRLENRITGVRNPTSNIAAFFFVMFFDSVITLVFIIFFLR